MRYAIRIGDEYAREIVIERYGSSAAWRIESTCRSKEGALAFKSRALAEELAKGFASAVVEELE